MKDRIRISDLASYYLTVAQRNLKMHGQPKYIPMRIAFGRSIQVGAEPVFEEKNIEVLEKAKNVRGNEAPYLNAFEQGRGTVFQAILSQKYSRKIEGDEYVDLITKHVEHGLWLIANETEKIKGYDYLVMLASAQNLNPDKNPQKKSDLRVSDSPSVLSVRIGVDKKTKEPINYDINLADNPHFGIMGSSGSGKTYFLKHLLTQIRKNSDYETHFVIFDYKDGDIAKDEEFINNCQAEVINIKQKPLPLNIFAGVENDEKEQKARAERIVEIVKNVEANIGKVQEDNLYNAILTAYQENKPYPDFNSVRQALQEINSKPDSLTSVLRPLIEQNYFANADQFIYGSWTNKTLIIDIHEIERKDLVCFFVLNQIHNELKSLGVAPVDSETKARKIRTFVVLDEAHYFLSSPKRAKILQNMIRDVRSTGGAIILASQSPDDYDKAEFNFLELIEFPVVLKSTPQSPKFLEQKFSLDSNRAKEILKEVGKLERGEGFIRVKQKPVVVELCD